MNGEDLGNCCQAEFPSDWPHAFNHELCNEAERTPRTLFRFLKSYFQSVFLKKKNGSPTEAASDIKGVWQQSLKDPPHPLVVIE